MRGKQFYSFQNLVDNRITPADAGKTEVFIADCTSRKDHPRGCGENPTFVPAVVEVIGSPPRMRGKLKRGLYFMEQWRITPADAGKTSLFALARTTQPDHPRGCGENTKKIL